MIERVSAPTLRAFVESNMEPMRVAKLKQFRKVTSAFDGWKITSSSGKKAIPEILTRVSIPVGATVYVGDLDGYANRSYLYRQFRANIAVVAENVRYDRPDAKRLAVIRNECESLKQESDFVRAGTTDLSFSIHDPLFEYNVGDTVAPRGRDFSTEEGYYGPGIHFFLDIYDALTYS